MKEVVAMADRRILILANRTATGTHLEQIVKQRMSEGSCVFTLVVPATPPPGTWTWTEGEANALATRRMEHAIKSLRKLGAEVEGIVEEVGPIDAVEAVMQIERHEHHKPFNEIIVSTLPPGISHWLKQDLPHRLEHRYKIPVTHVTAEEAHESIG
jgi:hypothetical protein